MIQVMYFVVSEPLALTLEAVRHSNELTKVTCLTLQRSSRKRTNPWVTIHPHPCHLYRRYIFFIVRQLWVPLSFYYDQWYAEYWPQHKSIQTQTRHFFILNRKGRRSKVLSTQDSNVFLFSILGIWNWKSHGQEHDCSKRHLVVSFLRSTGFSTSILRFLSPVLLKPCVKLQHLMCQRDKLAPLVRKRS